MSVLNRKNVLVAGGTGLIGMNLSQRLSALGANVLSSYHSRMPLSNARYERFDFTDFDDCLTATRDMDYVFICAAQTFGAKMMKEQPTALVRPNLLINSGLLEACRVNRVERTIFISSSTVYQEAFHPIREDELDLNRPPYPLYLGVGWMKRYIEQLAKFYVQRYGMQIGIVRPTNIYGPHDKFDDETSHVLPALIRRAIAEERPYVVWGDGYTVRDFLYVDDFIDDLLDVLDRYCVGDPVNVGSGSSITIREAVGVILDACGHDVIPAYDPTKPNAIPYRMVSLVKFQSLCGIKPRTSFAEGIGKVVAWYRSTIEKAGASGSGSLHEVARSQPSPVE